MRKKKKKKPKFGRPVKKKETEERKIWFFPCKNCGRHRCSSHKKKKATAGICAICRNNPVPDNQPKLI